MMTIFLKKMMKMSGIFNLKKNYKSTLLLLVFCYLTGCVTTRLEPSEITSDLQRLSYANANPVCINVKGEFDDLLGHQYVVPFIPVGEIKLDNSPKLFIYSSMYKVLSLGHFSPEFNSKSCKDILNINIQNMSLTAYDLFVTRKIVGKITYQIVYTRNGVIQDIREDTISQSSYKRYAFKTELEYTLNNILDEFSQRCIEMLKLY